jgi:hypothetical protein
MTAKRTLTIATVLVALATLLTLVGLLPTQASHVPPLVHEKNMSEFKMGMDHITTNEKETSVAVDPNNPNRLMAAANEAISGGRNVHEWYASSDGGRTFTRGQVPIDTNLTIEGVSNAEIEYSDPWLAYGSDGAVYHSAIAHADAARGASVVVQASSDQGSTWTDPADGIAGPGSTTPLLFHDKESMAVDRVHGDNVYLVWNPRQGPQGKQIVFTRDLGGWANGFAFSPTIKVSDFSNVDPAPPLPCRNHGPNVIVDASGTIWVVWTSFCDPFQGDTNGDPGTVWVAKSTDQGQHFGTPVKVATLFQVGGVDQPVPGISGAFRDFSDPSIASDPLTGRLFVAYATNANTTSDPDIEMVTSADGVTWSSSPIRVNQDTGTTTQLQPAVAVRDGRVVVNFYTTADGSEVVDDHLAYATASASPSFTEIRLTSASTPQPTGFLGDYTAVAFGNDGVAHAVWTDQRTGGDSDAYSARIDFSPPTAVAISAGPSKPFGQSASFTATVTGTHGETEQFIPVSFDVETSGAAVPGSGSGTSDASGQVSFSYSNAHAGTDTLRVWTDLDEDGNEDPGETSTLSLSWLKHPTVTAYTGPTLIADEMSVHLTALLTDAGSPVPGRLVTFTLGNGVTAQTCSDTTNLIGFASCNVVVHQPLGPGTVSAAFAGDSDYEPSSATAATTVFAYTVGGNFVIGDLDASGSGIVTFWGSGWSSANHISGGPAPSSFKGFANNPAGATSCGGTWSTSGGNSASPPASVPSYTAILVTTSVTESGGTISGTKPSLVIVRTNAGYQPSPGHAGTGHVVAVSCQ